MARYGQAWSGIENFTTARNRGTDVDCTYIYISIHTYISISIYLYIYIYLYIIIYIIYTYIHTYNIYIYMYELMVILSIMRCIQYMVYTELGCHIWYSVRMYTLYIHWNHSGTFLSYSLVIYIDITLSALGRSGAKTMSAVHLSRSCLSAGWQTHAMRDNAGALWSSCCRDVL